MYTNYTMECIKNNNKKHTFFEMTDMRRSHIIMYTIYKSR